MLQMTIFFWPTSRKVLPTFQTFCPVGVQIGQMVVDFATFKFRPGKRAFGGEVGGVLCTYVSLLSKKGVCDG